MIKTKEDSAKSNGKIMWEYILLTFAFAWGTELLMIIAYRLGLLSGGLGQFLHFSLIIIGPGLSPAYAAFIIQKRRNAVTFKAFCKQILYTDSMWITAFLAIVFACIQFVACVTQESYRGNPWYLFILYMPLMVLGGGLEEIGWRGVLQPQLEKRFSFLIAAVIEGALWSIWHLPLWFMPDTSQSTYNFAAFTLYCITLNCTLAAIYRLTKSLWASILIHAWGNTVLGGMYTYTSLTKSPSLKIIVIYIIQIVLIVLVCNIYSRIYRAHHRKQSL